MSDGIPRGRHTGQRVVALMENCTWSEQYGSALSVAAVHGFSRLAAVMRMSSSSSVGHVGDSGAPPAVGNGVKPGLQV